MLQRWDMESANLVGSYSTEEAALVAEAELRDALRSLRDEYHDDVVRALGFLESLRR